MNVCSTWCAYDDCRDPFLCSCRNLPSAPSHFSRAMISPQICRSPSTHMMSYSFLPAASPVCPTPHLFPLIIIYSAYPVDSFVPCWCVSFCAVVFPCSSANWVLESCCLYLPACLPACQHAFLPSQMQLHYISLPLCLHMGLPDLCHYQQTLTKTPESKREGDGESPHNV